jgi:chorismate mutase
MIETHPNPDKAWSDSAQQVTPEGLKNIIDQLVLRSKDICISDISALDELRHKIGDLDDKIFVPLQRAAAKTARCVSLFELGI